MYSLEYEIDKDAREKVFEIDLEYACNISTIESIDHRAQSCDVISSLGKSMSIWIGMALENPLLYLVLYRF